MGLFWTIKDPCVYKGEICWVVHMKTLVSIIVYKSGTKIVNFELLHFRTCYSSLSDWSDRKPAAIAAGVLIGGRQLNGRPEPARHAGRGGDQRESPHPVGPEQPSRHVSGVLLHRDAGWPLCFGGLGLLYCDVKFKYGALYSLIFLSIVRTLLLPFL